MKSIKNTISGNKAEALGLGVFIAAPCFRVYMQYYYIKIS